MFTTVLGLPAPTRVQYDIARFLSQDGSRLRFIQAFRGVGKSFLTCCYVVWRLWKNPNLKILIVSASEDLAVENATLIKMIIEADAGKDLWGHLKTPAGGRTSTMAFDVGGCVPDKSPSVKTTGITGSFTGSRADILIPDDIEVPKNSATEGQRDKLRALTGEFTDIVKPASDEMDYDGGEITWLGTPQTQESVYKGMAEKGYTIRVWTARYPLAEKLHNYLGTLAPMLLRDIEKDPTLTKPVGSTLGGAPTDPKRFNEVELQIKETGRGAAGFLLQYQLDTSLNDAEKFPLKTRDLIVADVDRKIAPVRLAWGSSPEQVLKDFPNVGFDGDRFFRPMYAAPEFVEFTGSVMIVDPSGRGKDETAYVVTKFLNGYVYVRRWGGFKDGYGDETLTRLAEIAAEEEVNSILCEDTFGDGMFRKLLEPVVRRKRPCPIDGYKRFTQKEVRIIDVLRPALAQHRVVMASDVIRADLAQPDNVKRGLYQLTHITEQRGALKHDDRIEVLAEGVKFWAEFLNADANAAEAAHQRREEQKWEREFFKGTIIGRRLEKPKGPPRGTGRNLRPSFRKVRW